MNFRGRIFWGIALAVLSMIALEALLDVAIDAITDRREQAMERLLDEALDRAEVAIASQGRQVGSSWQMRLTAERVVMVTLRRTTTAQPSGGAQVAAPDDRWMSADRARADGSVVTVAIARTAWERLSSSKLLLDLLDLPLFVAIAFIAALLLTRSITRPVRRLTAVAEDLAQQRFPHSAPIIPGHDELARLSQAFNRMTVAVQGYLERERTFTRYASHELRTPLAALKVQVERAQHGPASATDVLPALERNIQRLEEVIEALHSIARSGERDLKAKALPHVVQDVLGAVPAESLPRITIDTTVPNVLVTDAKLVRQALYNLLHNALKHGGTGPVALSVLAQHPALVLRVRDTGPGVDPKYLERLKEPFYRGNGTRQGLGLGLALVDMITHALEGELDLRNTGKGFEATMRLPIVTEAPS